MSSKAIKDESGRVSSSASTFQPSNVQISNIPRTHERSTCGILFIYHGGFAALGAQVADFHLLRNNYCFLFYCWKPDLPSHTDVLAAWTVSDEEILEKLLALNLERAKG